MAVNSTGLRTETNTEINKRRTENKEKEQARIENIDIYADGVVTDDEIQEVVGDTVDIKDVTDEEIQEAIDNYVYDQAELDKVENAELAVSDNIEDSAILQTEIDYLIASKDEKGLLGESINEATTRTGNTLANTNQELKTQIDQIQTVEDLEKFQAELSGYDQATLHNANDYLDKLIESKKIDEKIAAKETEKTELDGKLEGLQKTAESLRGAYTEANVKAFYNDLVKDEADLVDDFIKDAEDYGVNIDDIEDLEAYAEELRQTGQNVDDTNIFDIFGNNDERVDDNKIRKAYNGEGKYVEDIADAEANKTEGYHEDVANSANDLNFNQEAQKYLEELYGTDYLG